LLRDRDTDQRQHWTDQPGNRRVHRTDEISANAWSHGGWEDVAGALVIAPVIVLWASSHYHAFNRNEFLETVGVLATRRLLDSLLSVRLIEQTPSRDPLGFLAIPANVVGGAAPRST